MLLRSPLLLVPDGAPIVWIGGAAPDEYEDAAVVCDPLTRPGRAP